jgi:hypothetical protein
MGSISNLYSSIVSVHDPPRLYFEPLKNLNFDLNADPGPGFHSYADADPASKIMRLNKGPYPQPAYNDVSSLFIMEKNM